MHSTGAISAPMTMGVSPPISTFSNSNPKNNFPIKFPDPFHQFHKFPHFSTQKNKTTQPHFTLKASSVGGAELMEEPTTKVKFQTSLSLPGCSSALSLLGTGYREKVFAIVGVKVYAAGLYVNPSILSDLSSWKGFSSADIQKDLSMFKSLYDAPFEKSLQIVLVRDVDGKTFWDALDDAISPRIKAPTPGDESALSKFRSIFQGRSLKKGTFIFLTWLDPSQMLVSVSSDGLPSSADATIDSTNISSALFDVFFGDAPVSPSLKASVANRLGEVLK